MASSEATWLTVTPASGQLDQGQMVAITAPGGSIDWSATSDQDWLVIDPAAGTATPGNPSAVSLSAKDEAGNLSVGVHQANVTFTCATANKTKLISRKVSLDVLAEPVCTTEPVAVPRDDFHGYYARFRFNPETFLCGVFIDLAMIYTVFEIKIADDGSTYNDGFSVKIDDGTTWELWRVDSVTPGGSWEIPNAPGHYEYYLNFDTDTTIELTGFDWDGNVVGTYSGIFRVSSLPHHVTVTNFTKTN